jgi:hypothetical protein
MVMIVGKNISIPEILHMFKVEIQFFHVECSLLRPITGFLPTKAKGSGPGHNGIVNHGPGSIGQAG